MRMKITAGIGYTIGQVTFDKPHVEGKQRPAAIPFVILCLRLLNRDRVTAAGTRACGLYPITLFGRFSLSL